MGDIPIPALLERAKSLLEVHKRQSLAGLLSVQLADGVANAVGISDGTSVLAFTVNDIGEYGDHIAAIAPVVPYQMWARSLSAFPVAANIAALRDWFASVCPTLPARALDAECDECLGSGCVEWTYYSQEYAERFEAYQDCPVCEGNGYGARSREAPPCYLRIAGCSLNGRKVERFLDLLPEGDVLMHWPIVKWSDEPLGLMTSSSVAPLVIRPVSGDWAFFTMPVREGNAEEWAKMPSFPSTHLAAA